MLLSRALLGWQIASLMGSADVFLNMGSLYVSLCRHARLRMCSAHRGWVFLREHGVSVRHLRVGLNDVATIPSSTLLDSPVGMAQGIAGGAASLARNAVSGVVGSVGGLTGVVNRGLSHLSLDKQVVQDEVRLPCETRSTLYPIASRSTHVCSAGSACGPNPHISIARARDGGCPGACVPCVCRLRCASVSLCVCDLWVRRCRMRCAFVCNHGVCVCMFVVHHTVPPWG